MIECKDLSKEYLINKTDKVEALSNINITLPDKGFILLSGKSGSGKSTLLNLIGTLDLPTKGKIILDKKDLSTLTKSELDYYRSNYVSFIFQDYNLFSDMTVKQNILLSLNVKRKQLLDEEILVTLNKLDIADLYERKCNTLSGGQKQRVAIARAIINNSKIILADEPTAAIDSKTTLEICELLKELSKDRLVLVVSHDEETMRKYADNTIKLSDGKVVESDLDKYSSDNCIEIKKNKPISILSVLKLGFRNIRVKKFNLILSLVLFILSFSLLAVSVSFSRYDKYEVLYRTHRKEGRDYISLGVRINYERYDGANCGNGYIFFDDMLDSLEKETGLNDYVISYRASINFDDYFIEENDNYIGRFIDGIIQYDESYLKRFNMKMVAGHAPQNDNEIVLTTPVLDQFIKYGYVKDGKIINPSTYDELIGLDFDGYTLSGIVDFEYNKKIINKSEKSDRIMEAKWDIFQNSFALIAFVYNEDKYIEYKEQVYIVSEFMGINHQYEERDLFLFNKEDSSTIESLADDEVIFGLNEYIYDVYGASSENLVLKIMAASGLSYSEASEKLIEEISPTIDAKTVKISFCGIDSKGEVEANAKEYKIKGYSLDSGFIVNQNVINEKNSKKLNSSSAYNIHHEFTSNHETNIKLIKLSSFESKNAIIDSYGVEYSFSNYDDLNNDIDRANDSLTIISYIFLGAAAMLFIISVLSMINNVNTCISYQKKDVGILKSLGYKTIDIFRVFNLKNIFIGVISILFSLILSLVFMLIINGFYTHKYIFQIVIVNFTHIEFLLIFFVGIIVPIIATIIPIISISKKKPIDVIYRSLE